jgi:hypothetical protein
MATARRGACDGICRAEQANAQKSARPVKHLKGFHEKNKF